MNKGKNCFRIIYFLSFLSFFIPFFSTQAIEYQRVSLGDTIRIGEFLYEDDYTPSTADCTLTIYNPAGILKDTVTMLENANGWHYYDYAVGAGEALGNWPTSMACGTAGVDLVIADKTFTVIPIKGGWTVTLSDFGGTTVNTAYKAKLQVLNYLTVPADADSDPVVVIKDPLGSAPVPAPVGTMSRDSAGTYSFSYSIGASAVGGVWETVVSVVINGQTIKVNDYWTVSSSPADVNITEITDKVIPTITARVRIDNKGTQGSDFYYVYCIVSSENNLCGGNDDVDSASGTAFINAGSFINLSLTLDEVLTAGTYWFKVKARALAETNWAASTKQFTAESPVVPPPPPPPPTGGGGGGGGYIPPPVVTQAIFTGRAYPKSTVTLLKDAQIAAITIADTDANFSISVSGISGGNYIFSVYAEDTKGYRSPLLSFPIGVTTGATTNVSGIFIAPTIAVDKSEVKKGENIAIFGQSIPLGDITITVNSHEEFFEKTKADATGIYLLNFDTSLLAMGQYIAKSKAAFNGEISTFGKIVSFIVSTRTVFETTRPACSPRADLNADCKVNLVDFSIAAYWYKRPISAEFALKEAERLNGDGKVDLIDFSIMAYYWTG